jgi:hypothetical protein
MKFCIQILLVATTIFLISCEGSDTYSIGVFNNTRHTPIKVKIQYPSPDGMKRIRFPMIGVGEFSADWLDTKTNPIPPKAKISWENSKGEKRNAVLDLSEVPTELDDGAVIIDIDENDASVNYLGKQQFSDEWEKRLIRKGYK